MRALTRLLPRWGSCRRVRSSKSCARLWHLVLLMRKTQPSRTSWTCSAIKWSWWRWSMQGNSCCFCWTTRLGLGRPCSGVEHPKSFEARRVRPKLSVISSQTIHTVMEVKMPYMTENQESQAVQSVKFPGQSCSKSAACHQSQRLLPCTCCPIRQNLPFLFSVSVNRAILRWGKISFCAAWEAHWWDLMMFGESFYMPPVMEESISYLTYRVFDRRQFSVLNYCVYPDEKTCS